MGGRGAHPWDAGLPVLKLKQAQAKQDELAGHPKWEGNQKTCSLVPALPLLSSPCLAVVLSPFSPSFGFFTCKMACVPLSTEIKSEDIL